MWGEREREKEGTAQLLLPLEPKVLRKKHHCYRRREKGRILTRIHTRGEDSPFNSYTASLAGIKTFLIFIMSFLGDSTPYIFPLLLVILRLVCSVRCPLLHACSIYSDKRRRLKNCPLFSPPSASIHHAVSKVYVKGRKVLSPLLSVRTSAVNLSLMTCNSHSLWWRQVEGEKSGVRRRRGGNKKGKRGECFPALEGQANTFKRGEILFKVNLMFLYRDN